ncbi:FKBP-type 22 kDa peptidyl-prolyl cis-trans isomerase [termite gut metagenome]|uniref:peptidylprolyl isomerase n=1 Tax=termite gut metagenome TaxID=433724 RepID=A0A5J4RDQ9_9ZZZZ
MSKKKIYLPVLLLSLFAFICVSCEETEEIGKYDNWQARNEAFIDSLQQVFEAKIDPELLNVVDSRNKNQKIFYKKLPDSMEKGGLPPYLTSKVTVFYRGMLINEKVFGKAPAPRYYTTLYNDLDVFDKNFTGDSYSEFDSPVSFTVSGVIDGWIEILQWMKVGERWEVYIPWESAYGTTGSGSIPGYSALIFDILLVDFNNP